MLQAGGQADVPAHDVDAVVVQRARQVQARLGRVLLQLDPLPRGDVVGLHRKHVLRLVGTPLPPVRLQLMGVAANQVDGVLHREHLLLADVRRTRPKHGPGVGGGVVAEDARVPVCQTEKEKYVQLKEAAEKAEILQPKKYFLQNISCMFTRLNQKQQTQQSAQSPGNDRRHENKSHQEPLRQQKNPSRWLWIKHSELWTVSAAGTQARARSALVGLPG